MIYFGIPTHEDGIQIFFLYTIKVILKEDKSNHQMFGSASCLWFVSRKLSGFNKYSNNAHQPRSSLVTFKKFIYST